MINRIFVYGTLRRGDQSQQNSLVGNAIYLGEGTVSGQLFDLGNYPGAVPGTGRILGEVYQLTNFEEQIAVLDDYEEINLKETQICEYVRETTLVSLSSGEVFPVWIYWYQRSTADFPPITSGDWLKSRPEKSC